MRALVLACLAFGLVMATPFVVICCNTQSPVFTPKPNDPAYPCHLKDGTTVPDGVVCGYVSGVASCCRVNFSCQPPPFFCEFEGDPNWNTDTFGARKRVTEARTESR